ncbi:MAG: phage tail protein [Clostridiales bacterium]|nr:phage tail protein [Clostridiales bacterium]
MPKQGISTIGATVTIGENKLNYVTEFADIGGSPSELDATCMKDSMKHYVPGVQDTKSYEVTYLFDNTDASSDFRVLKALQDAGSIVPIVVEFSDGTKQSSTGYVNTYTVGAKVDELITAKAVLMLQSDWTVTNPTT